MRTLLKITGGIILVVVVAAVAGLTYLKTALPNIDAPSDLQVERTNERIEHGEYLANNVMSCMHCHSPQQKTKFAHPAYPDSLGAGGTHYGPEEGIPGHLYTPNITPAGIGDWSDGELYRAITSGVSKDGRPLFPLMPYLNYSQMAKEDIYSVIAYLRTLYPIENEVPASELAFPMNFIVHTIPAPPQHQPAPDTANPVAWGKYLVTAASCADCHTPKEQGADIPGMEFAGGMEFPMIDGSTARTANITPDVKTGIGSWDEKAFIKRFKDYADTSFVFDEVAHGQFNTAMPWKNYSQMGDKELKAIYAYLQTVVPVQNEIVKFTPVNQ
ncbi:c-type cytochrome [Gracilimonas mengyeensis]|uniref:Cytochrome c n=1 Tax=Gracilimonas mengyeensis TaxID=1302730 RepID=A0A521BGZ0_9BACT|nr:cytochrome c [Gracilimonas mengyeensis]SMO46201.1 Cytochrome c [Gracilimonas mengyeensis]